MVKYELKGAVTEPEKIRLTTELKVNARGELCLYLINPSGLEIQALRIDAYGRVFFVRGAAAGIKPDDFTGTVLSSGGDVPRVD